jgi:excisionase family DNA binding protein
MVSRCSGVSDPALGTQLLAEILRCSPRTVTKLIDSGQLPGFRIPGSRTRRVLRSDLVAFCVANQFPAVILTAAQTADEPVADEVGSAADDAGDDAAEAS